MVGQHVLGSLDPAFNAARCAHWSDVLQDGQPRRAAFSRTEQDGKVGWYQMLSLPFGECIAALTRNASAEADESRRRGPGWNDDLLASVSHELRTPLNAIVGWSHLLGRADADVDDGAAGRRRHRPQRARAGLADRRPARHQPHRHRDACGSNAKCATCRAAVLRAVEAARPASQTRWIHLHTDEVTPSLQCWGDPKRLEQMLGNLLTRAVQSTPLDGAIHVAAHAHDGRARVLVRDTGDGIAPGELPQLFDRFGQADASKSRHHGGLGLGLAIVRSLVELHGGELAVRSDGARARHDDRGGPAAGRCAGGAAAAAARCVAPADAAVAAQPETAPAAADAPLAWRRILVLEDEADSLELMTVLLRQQGAIVQAFDNAEEALAAAENGSFDLIISDLGMAGMDGLEFMRRLKRRPVPVKAMALTAYSGDAHRALALDAGYTRVEVKPISPPQFLAVVVAEAGRGLPGTITSAPRRGA